MVAFSKLTCKSSLGFVSIQLLCASAIIKILQCVLAKQQRNDNKKPKSRVAIGIDRLFFRRFFSLVRICIPGVFSFESMCVMIMCSLLLLRTKLTLLIARTVGLNGKYLAQKDYRKFAYGVADIGLLAIPGSVIHVGVEYTKSMIQQLFRDNLQRTLHAEYLYGNNMYVIASQNSIDNPDHRISEDAKNFCSEFTDLFQSVLKPVVDVVTFSMELTKLGGSSPPAFLMSYYLFVASVMSAVLPNFARLVASSQEKEGNLRTKHSQLVQHAEEVAFYGGEELERIHADHLLHAISRHEKRIKKVNFFSGILDSVAIKYGAVCVGYVVCGAVVFDQRNNLSKADLTDLYLRSSQLYIPLSRAIGTLLLMHRKIGALAGSTYRLGELRDALAKISQAYSNLRDQEALVIQDVKEISFSDVDVVSPTGEMLIQKFTAQITQGSHVLIMGVNGSGKSAILRTFTGLWPLGSGRIVRPDEVNVMCLPQKAYFSPGTLREQMLYPYTEEVARKKNIDDAMLMRFAGAMNLTQMIEREGGLDASADWSEVLSGGERQRIALIRVLCHRPAFAFLDECTSAVSQDDEVRLYSQLQEAGITLITISHREALKSIHQTLIELNGKGGYHLSKLSA